MKSEIEIFDEWYTSIIKLWRKSINDYMLREYGFILEFDPKLEGE